MVISPLAKKPQLENAQRAPFSRARKNFREESGAGLDAG